MTGAVKSLSASGPRANGAWDEAHTEDGRVRRLYEGLFDDLAGVDLEALCHAVSGSMRDGGVIFSGEVFPMDPVPRLIEADEWYWIARGVEQRGRALAAFVADVYGDREIVRAGLVPERVIEEAVGFSRG